MTNRTLLGPGNPAGRNSAQEGPAKQTQIRDYCPRRKIWKYSKPAGIACHCLALFRTLGVWQSYAVAVLQQQETTS